MQLFLIIFKISFKETERIQSLFLVEKSPAAEKARSGYTARFNSNSKIVRFMQKVATSFSIFKQLIFLFEFLPTASHIDWHPWQISFSISVIELV